MTSPKARSSTGLRREEVAQAHDPAADMPAVMTHPGHQNAPNWPVGTPTGGVPDGGDRPRVDALR